MIDILVPSALAAAGLAALGAERVRLEAFCRRIPLRIAVTGTRGKSTVTRLVAAALRADGRIVLAKTTGSRPALIGPGGEETEIRRPGPPSILEQRSVVRAAVRMRADALVAEMMSIGPETLRAEAGKILRPHILVVTNARLDHREEMGRTREEIAATLARAFIPGVVAFLPEEEMLPIYAEAARRVGCRLTPISGDPAERRPVVTGGAAVEFPVNIRLAEAVARYCGVDDGRLKAGLAAAAPDFGSLKAWRLRIPEFSPPACAVSLFAANEPESTALSLERLALAFPGLPERRVAVLAFRADREDRTRQWLEAAGRGFFKAFAGIMVLGDHALPIARRLRRLAPAGTAVSASSASDPARIMAAAVGLAGGDACLIGMGNIVGIGTALIDFWAANGEPV
ncbi:MAG: Mur ligase family protein [Candidatus Aminicenantes bacterium]|nr:Mur ligase family protein [Candidatus Aminicenantes bacterium]